MAFVGANGCFMGVDEEGDIVSKSKKAGPAEYIQVMLFLIPRPAEHSSFCLHLLKVPNGDVFPNWLLSNHQEVAMHFSSLEGVHC